MLRIFLYVFFLLWLASCTSIDTPLVSSKPIWRLGLVRIQGPDNAEDIDKLDVTSVGAWLGKDNFGIGYKSTTRLAISDECKVVFLVKNEQQLKQVKTLILSQLEKHRGELCAEID